MGRIHLPSDSSEPIDSGLHQEERFGADLAALTGAAPVAAEVGVAVSGGADSLALLLLCHAVLGAGVSAATVDHGLRPEAQGEAAQVAANCAARGVAHRTLRVTTEAGGDGLQAAARDARYAALAHWARAQGLRWLLTAHHADDQAETLLMRLSRGAGVGGLAGIRARRPLGGGVTLLRPLLGWRRAELRALVDAAGLTPADDPSNRDPRFDRTAARALIGSAGWIDPLRLARSAHALAEAEAALAWTAAEAARSRLVRDGEAVSLDAAGLPAELRRRLLGLALASFGAAADGPESDRLLARLDAGKAATIRGLKIVPGPPWRFVPAPPRRAR